VANAIQEIITGIKTAGATEESDSDETEKPPTKKIQLTSEIKRRNVLRASLVYILAAVIGDYLKMVICPVSISPLLNERI